MSALRHDGLEGHPDDTSSWPMYHVGLVGAISPKRASAAGLCNACLNRHTSLHADEDLAATGDCSPDEVRKVRPQPRRVTIRGETYRVLDFGGYGAEAAYFCSVIAKASESEDTAAWQFVGSAGPGLPDAGQGSTLHLGCWPTVHVPVPDRKGLAPSTPCRFRRRTPRNLHHS